MFDGIQTAVYNRNLDCFWILFTGRERIIARFDCTSGKLYYPPKNNVDELLGHFNPVSLFKLDKNGNLWFANYLGDLCKYNTFSNNAEHYEVLHQRNKEKIGTPNSTVYEILDDGNNTIWFAGDYYIGLLNYDKKNDRFSFVQNENGSEYGLHYDEDIYSLFKDREGNIWVDTDLGLNIFNPVLQQFKYLEKTTGSSITQFSADVTSIYESKKKDIWISTWGNGIFKYDSNFVFQKNYVHEKQNPQSLGEPLNRTWAFAEDKHNKLWVGCQYGMLSILNTITGKFINKIIPDFDKFTITNLAKDKKNNIWFVLYNGNLATWNANSAKIIVFKNLLKDNTPIDGLCIDPRNNIWITAGKYGLCEFDRSNEILTRNILPAQHAILTSSLNDSIIAGSTADNRIFFYNTFTGASHFFDIAKSTSSNNIQRILIHRLSDIWFLTNDEIGRLNTNNLKISSYNINDGIRDHFFEQASLQTSNGNILVAGHSGVIYFNPDNIKTIPPPPDVSITDLNIEQQNLSVDSLMQYDSVSLFHNQNEITINYASLSFIGRNTDEYLYQMEGVDLDWIFAGKRRSVTYANLVPGNYIFKVKSKNRDGLETEHVTYLHIIINPPWQKTWWAYLMWIFVLASILYAIYDYRKRVRKELSRIRQKIATDLHDDIGSTLNSISVYSEIAGKQLQTNTENAKDLLNKMGASSRNMIDTMNDIVWAINPKNDQFENILQRMQYFAGELLSGKNILLQFEVHDKVKSIKLPMEKRKNVYLIFKEAITNAYKYSNAKTVNVTITAGLNILLMIIADDGIGFDTDKKSLAGNGLKNMETRAKEIGARLNVTSLQTKSTRVELRIPVK